MKRGYLRLSKRIRTAIAAASQQSYEAVVVAADEKRSADRMGFQRSSSAENGAVGQYGSSNKGSGVERGCCQANKRVDSRLLQSVQWKGCKRVICKRVWSMGEAAAFNVWL